MIFGRIRERSGALLFAAIVSVLLVICGAVMASVLSSRQAIESRRVARLVKPDLEAYAAASAGEDVVVTGILQDNPVTTDYDLVAYRIDEWRVVREDDGDTEGHWAKVEMHVPALRLSLHDQTLHTLAAANPDLDGDVRTFVVPGEGALKAEYDDQSLSEGSLRIRGFENGDLITVVGYKASTGDLRPDRLYGGDWTQMADEMRASARSLFVAGLVTMGCGPVLFTVSALAVLFKRRRRRLW